MAYNEDIDKTLADLTDLLKKKQLALQERENEVEKRAASLEKESHFLANKSPSDVLHLNIGGTCIAVLRSTLTSVEDSMLASKFSGRWDDSLEKDRDDNFFIDQPIELFLPMVNYLRATKCEIPSGPPVKSPHDFKSYDQRQDFYRMCEYFGMTLGVYPCNIELHRGEVGSADISNYPDFSVISREWSTFTIQISGHNREIVSYEVVLGNVERMQIGWINEEKYIENLTNEPHNGVGEEANSIALDCCRGGLLNQGEFTKLGLSIGAGSVIRCEQKTRRYFVNGKLVVSSIASDNAVYFENELLPPVHGKLDKIIPSFSGKGNWKVSQIVLSNP